MSPPPDVLDRLRQIVDAVAAEHGFAESFVRASKVGGRLDVEVDYVVTGTSTAQTVHEFDAVRATLRDRFAAAAGQQPSMVVGFTADREWAIR